MATGSTPSFTMSLRGGRPVMSGSGWWGHTLKAEVAYVSNNHLCTLSTLPGLISKGGYAGGGGGSVRFKQPQGANSLPFESYFLASTCGGGGGAAEQADTEGGGGAAEHSGDGEQSGVGQDPEPFCRNGNSTS